MEKILLAEVYESFLSSRNAQATKRAYRWPVHRLQQFLDEKGIGSPFLAQESHLLELFKRIRSGHKDSSCSMFRNAMNAFFFWAIDMGLTKENPARRLSRERLKIFYQPKPFSDDEKEKFLLALRYRDYSETRVSAAFLLSFHAGMRVGEICGLKPEGLDFDSGTISFVGKGSKPAVVPMSPAVKTALTRLMYLQEARFGDKRLCPVPYVFASTRYPHRKPNTRHFQVSFKEMALRCKITRSVRFHHGRHTFGTSVARKTQNIFKVKEAMRFSDYETAQHYVDLTSEEKKAAFSAAW